MVTAAGDRSTTDVVSRCLAPAVGIPEDPVTGAAHCTIGPWWARRLGTTLRCHQASARGGDLLVTVAEDRVGLAGHAVTVLRAELQAERLSR
jgi:predicted PhzF superfamily epimerase YddE/YHI9